ncbi:MAG: bifunctional pyr operon transcriptional regulator/uracil phosphoribosyltransferase PyrR [Immundisolibacter sp.]
MPNTPTEAELAAALERLAGACAAFELDDPLLVGIETGGRWVAQWLRQRLGLGAPVAGLEVGFYRDDLQRSGLKSAVRPSSLPPSVDNRNIVLVDDVLHTGRTVSAALRELFDFGRPACVRLLVLVDRGGRELPVAADAVGLQLALPADRRLRLTGPQPLRATVEPA